MDLYGTSRLFEKNPRDAIIKQIQDNFNLAPLIAKAYFERIGRYFSEHTDLTFKTGKKLSIRQSPFRNHRGNLYLSAGDSLLP